MLYYKQAKDAHGWSLLDRMGFDNIIRHFQKKFQKDEVQYNEEDARNNIGDLHTWKRQCLVHLLETGLKLWNLWFWWD